MTVWKFFYIHCLKILLYPFKQKYCDLSSFSIWNRKTAKFKGRVLQMFLKFCADVFTVDFVKLTAFLLFLKFHMLKHGFIWCISTGPTLITRKNIPTHSCIRRYKSKSACSGISLCRHLSLESSVLVLRSVSWFLSDFHRSRY